MTTRTAHPLWKRLAALLFGFALFLAVIPYGLLLLFRGLDPGVRPARGLELLVVALAGPVALLFLGWTTWAQWFPGRGTPNPFVPTRRLVVSGPYRLCRNPLHLGWIHYLLAFGTLVDGLETGVLSLLGGLVGGAVYHRVFEERRLVRKFGDEYEVYRRSTPFLVPRIRLKGRTV